MDQQIENEIKDKKPKLITQEEMLDLCLESYAKGFHDAFGVLERATKEVTLEKLKEIRRTQVPVKE